MQTYEIEVLLLDDEEASLELSKKAILRFVPEEMIHTAHTVEEVLDILETVSIRLAFLDVELAQGDGFTLCEAIHRLYPGLKVVFLTGHVDLGAKSYDYEPFDFLVKPVDVLRLERTFHRFTVEQAKHASPVIAIETSAGFVQLNLQDVLYISKSGNSCLVHCIDNEEHKVSSPLDKLEAMLEGRDFFRTHQSFLVSVERIRQVKMVRYGTSYEAILDDGTSVPVSRSKYTALKDFIMRRSVHL